MRGSLAVAILAFSLLAFLTGAITREITQNGKPQSNRPDTSKPESVKARGQFVVASRDLPDPLFHDSVVLMLPIKEEQLIVGLIVNKPTKIKLSEVFPDAPALQKSEAKAYFGGPVDLDVGARSAIFRSKAPPEDATMVFEDVYVSFDAKSIAALAANPQQVSTLRVYLGRAQWATDQFEGEVARGSWHSLPASVDSIFSAQPEMLWPSLIEHAEPRPVVQSRPPFAFSAAMLFAIRSPAVIQGN